jgi:GNAT superfamily N-acetyltransferase
MTRQIDNPSIHIRAARPEDGDQISLLCRQLGYPVETVEVQARLQLILGRPDHAVYVAEVPPGVVVGWVHVYGYLLLETELQAAIGGLIVDKAYRQRGIGKRLMAPTEQWARKQGFTAVRLRSNLIREEAHAFYKRIGYTVQKTPLLFVKKLK